MNEQQRPYRPTTTHAEWGAGHPSLRISRDGGERSLYGITTDEVAIGSAAGNDIVLAGTDATHATIRHDDRDEYVLTLHGAGEMNANSATVGEGEDSEILRTGARFVVGDWTLVFSREEFADHGRPYGGREGGELSDQPAQPARPDYSDPQDSPGPEAEVKDA